MLFRSRATFAPLSSVRTSGSTPTLPIKITLFTISPRYKCFSHLRAEKVRQRVTKSFTEEFDETEINEYIKNETFRIVMNALEDLPPGSRNVFSRAIQGYSAKEIAEELGIAVETVKKQKQVARRLLKEKLGNLFTLFFTMA